MTTWRKTVAVGSCCVFCVFSTVAISQEPPPGFLGRTKQYRSSKAATFGGGTNANAGTPRTTTAFLPVDDTNSTSIIAVPQTVTITTNAVSATNPNGIFIPEGSSMTFSVPAKTDLKIRSMTVQVIMKATWPLQSIVLTVAKDAIPPLALGLTGNTTLGNVDGSIATLTFDPNSVSDFANLTSLQVFTNNVTFTGKLSGGQNFSTFTNQSAAGTWSVTMESLNPSGGSNFFRGFTIAITSDSVGSVTFDGKTVDLTPRRVKEKNPTRPGPNGTPVSVPTRFESEK